MVRAAWRQINRLPPLQVARRVFRKLRHTYARHRGPGRLRRQIASTGTIKVVLGSANRYDVGWIPTEVDFLNLVKPEDWARFFEPGSIDALLAEHVWEHLTEEQGVAAARTCFRYLKPGGYIRVAVPDGFHPDPNYQQRVRVGGTTPWNGHKSLYTYQTFRALFEDTGFEVTLYEYFDEAGKFHFREWDRAQGTIWRSKRFDPRNRGGQLGFTSILLDARKTGKPATATQIASTATRI